MANDPNKPSAALDGMQPERAEERLPQLPRPRMPRVQRAKIFIPFDPLKGYQAALRAKEREAEALHYERAELEDE